MFDTFRVTIGVFQVANDNHQEVVKVVGNSAAELADSFHLLRSRELLLRLFQHPLRLHSLGDVAGYLCKANHVAAFVSYRVNYHQRRKIAPIFTQPRALGLISAFTGGSLKRLLGNARLPMGSV